MSALSSAASLILGHPSLGSLPSSKDHPDRAGGEKHSEDTRRPIPEREIQAFSQHQDGDLRRRVNRLSDALSQQSSSLTLSVAELLRQEAQRIDSELYKIKSGRDTDIEMIKREVVELQHSLQESVRVLKSEIHSSRGLVEACQARGSLQLSRVQELEHLIKVKASKSNDGRLESWTNEIESLIDRKVKNWINEETRTRELQFRDINNLQNGLQRLDVSSKSFKENSKLEGGEPSQTDMPQVFNFVESLVASKNEEVCTQLRREFRSLARQNESRIKQLEEKVTELPLDECSWEKESLQVSTCVSEVWQGIGDLSSETRRAIGGLKAVQEKRSFDGGPETDNLRQKHLFLESSFLALKNDVSELSSTLHSLATSELKRHDEQRAGLLKDLAAFKNEVANNFTRQNSKNEELENRRNELQKLVFSKCSSLLERLESLDVSQESRRMLDVQTLKSDIKEIEKHLALMDQKICTEVSRHSSSLRQSVESAEKLCLDHAQTFAQNLKQLDFELRAVGKVEKEALNTRLKEESQRRDKQVAALAAEFSGLVSRETQDLHNQLVRSERKSESGHRELRERGSAVEKQMDERFGSFKMDLMNSIRGLDEKTSQIWSQLLSKEKQASDKHVELRGGLDGLHSFTLSLVQKLKVETNNRTELTKRELEKKIEEKAENLEKHSEEYAAQLVDQERSERLRVDTERLSFLQHRLSSHESAVKNRISENQQVLTDLVSHEKLMNSEWRKDQEQQLAKLESKLDEEARGIRERMDFRDTEIEQTAFRMINDLDNSFSDLLATSCADLKTQQETFEEKTNASIAETRELFERSLDSERLARREAVDKLEEDGARFREESKRALAENVDALGSRLEQANSELQARLSSSEAEMKAEVERVEAALRAEVDREREERGSEMQDSSAILLEEIRISRDSLTEAIAELDGKFGLNLEAAVDAQNRKAEETLEDLKIFKKDVKSSLIDSWLDRTVEAVEGELENADGAEVLANLSDGLHAQLSVMRESFSQALEERRLKEDTANAEAKIQLQESLENISAQVSGLTDKHSTFAERVSTLEGQKEEMEALKSAIEKVEEQQLSASSLAAEQVEAASEQLKSVAERTEAIGGEVQDLLQRIQDSSDAVQACNSSLQQLREEDLPKKDQTWAEKMESLQAEVEGVAKAAQKKEEEETQRSQQAAEELQSLRSELEQLRGELDAAAEQAIGMATGEVMRLEGALREKGVLDEE